MSLGYAEKLSYKEDVGTVGMSEIFEPSHVLDEKIAELALLIQKSKHLVAFTGAGISTSCGIPDFRGPKGIWTLQREGKCLPEASLPFHRAMPSLTHMALVELERIGILKFVISQNVDCLHLRSGIPREKLSELHGNSFREICPSCGTEYIRDFEIETIGMKQTSRRCSNCDTKLRDTVLDWEDALPSKEMDPASKHCRKSDLVLCLGTSLQIIPACNLPLKAIRGGGKVVIVNLQETPKDKKASLVIHGQVDKVIAAVMQILNFRIPPYIRIDFVRIIFGHARKNKTSMQWTLNIQSIHGTNAPLPFIKSIEVYTDQGEAKNVLMEKQPFCIKRQARKEAVFKIFLKFNLIEGCGCSHTIIEWPVDFAVEDESISPDRNEILQKLRDKAESEGICGQNSILERKVLPKSETTVVAVVTNIFKYNVDEKSGNATISKHDAEDDDEKPSKRLKQS